jgi:hypothetical protein
MKVNNLTGDGLEGMVAQRSGMISATQSFLVKQQQKIPST